jgi:hypothetical protein
MVLADNPESSEQRSEMSSYYRRHPSCCPRHAPSALVKSIHFRNTNLSQLPDNIGNLKNLHQLDVSGNKISKLPRNYRQIAVYPSPVTHCRNDLCKLQKLVRIEAIARYFEELDRGVATISRKLKVVLVGDGEASKTSLRHAMAGHD